MITYGGRAAPKLTQPIVGQGIPDFRSEILDFLGCSWLASLEVRLSFLTQLDLSSIDFSLN